MDYSELLHTIKSLGYSRIAVTGLLCSGVGLAAKCLAADLKIELVPPEVFDHFDYLKFIHRVCLKRRYVVCCPLLLPYLQNMPDDVFVVMLSRDIADVEESQRRHKVLPSERETDIFNQYKVLTARDLNHAKLQFIERFVAPARQFEYLDFTSLEHHPFFRARQIAPPINPARKKKKSVRRVVAASAR